MPARQEPAHVAPQEAALYRRVDVRLLVGEGMVVTVVRSPPDRAALNGGSAEQSEHELAGARSLEGAMGKIAVIKTRDRKHSDHIHESGGDQRRGTDAN